MTLWTVARQGPQSMGFSGQEYWSGLPCPSQEDLPKPGIKPRSPALQADFLPFEPCGKRFILKKKKNKKQTTEVQPKTVRLDEEGRKQRKERGGET